MLEINNIRKSFNGREVLKSVSLNVKDSEYVAMIGRSGSGKTTLVRMVNGFVIPDAGTIKVKGTPINYHNGVELRQARKKIGMIYQLFNLVDRSTAIDNVLTGALGRMDRGLDLISSSIGIFPREEKEKALEQLQFVGLGERAYQRVDKLSGGEKQRVAIARALMQEPYLLLADEPIANLDPKTSMKILDLLKKVNEEKGITVITILHHLESVKDSFDRVVAMKEGTICYDGRVRDLPSNWMNEIYGTEEEQEMIVNNVIPKKTVVLTTQRPQVTDDITEIVAN
jgi:phosphonate transport system ATP-binding protein